MRAPGAAFSRHADDQEARYGDRVHRTRTESTRLVILRGNSASGKSSTAAAIRARHGRRDLAIIGQDHLRRVVLREHDVPGGANIGLIDMVARYAPDRGFHTIVEGIFRADHYAGMLTGLCADHRGLTLCDYFDVPFNETVRRIVRDAGLARQPPASA
jgi:predicted kinase